MSNKFSFTNLVQTISKMISDEAVVEKDKNRNAHQKGHSDEIQNSILVLAADVIRCNRNYTADTEKFIQAFLAKHFGNEGIKQKLKAIDSHLTTGTEPFTKIACKELKMLTTHDSRLNIIHFLFGVAAADDFVNAKETRCINRIATYLGISDKDFKEIKQSFINQDNPYNVLGIEDGASINEVRTAYRKLVLKYHPDKREAHISEEEANHKFREIKRAFDTISEILGG